MGYLFPYVTANQAFVGAPTVSNGAPLRYEVLEIGNLTITGTGFMQRLCRVGELVAADAFVTNINPGPFRKLVPAGRHPVTLAIAHLASGERRVAFARVRFSSAPSVSWQNAIVDEDDEYNARTGEQWGYGVDSACGCFMSARAAKLLAEQLEVDSPFEMEVLRQLEANRGLWVDFHPSPSCDDNVIAFNSGFGDGIYASCFGLDADGRVTDVITDFKVGNRERTRDGMDVLRRIGPRLLQLQAEREAARREQPPE